MRKHCTVWLALVALLFLAPSAPAADLRPVDWIVVVVDADIITFTQFVEELRLSAARGGRTIENLTADEKEMLADEVLEKLVTESVLVQEARRRGVTVTPAEIDEETSEALERLRAQFVDQNAFERALAAEFTTSDRIRDRYRVQAETMLLRGKLVDREVRRKVKVTDSDVMRAYERRGEEAKVLQAIFTDSASAAAFRSRLTPQSDFVQVGREAGALESTDLGWIRRGRSPVPALDEAVFSTAAGQVSGIIRTRYGYHVLRVAERRNSALPELSEDLREEIFNELFAQRYEEMFQVYMQDLRSRSYVEVREEALKTLF